MTKIDKTIIKETKIIALGTLILSAIMQGVFLLLGFWDYTVLLGNILSAVACVFNFLIMGITVQKSLGKDVKEIKQRIKLSSTLRLIMLFAVVVVGVVLACFNTWSVLIPLLFPRIVILVRPLFDKSIKKDAPISEERRKELDQTYAKLDQEESENAK